MVVSFVILSDILDMEMFIECVDIDVVLLFLSIFGVVDVMLDGERECVLCVFVDFLWLISFGLLMSDIVNVLLFVFFDVFVGSI